jgi:hypothetical protein
VDGYGVQINIRVGTGNYRLMDIFQYGGGTFNTPDDGRRKFRVHKGIFDRA